MNDLQILASSVRNLSGLILQAEEGLKGELDEERKEEADDDDDKEEEDGKEEMVEEQPAVRPLGGFEKFFGTCGTLGLGLIYFVADVSGPLCTEMLARAMRMCVKRHPNLRSHLVPGYVYVRPLPPFLPSTHLRLGPVSDYFRLFWINNSSPPFPPFLPPFLPPLPSHLAA